MIHRGEHEDGFTVINNSILRDTNLSDGAARLLLYMLSMSDEWSFSTNMLAKTFNVAKSTIVARVTELKKAGYIKTKNVVDDKGHFKSVTWDIFEEPQTAFGKNPCSEISVFGSDRIRTEPHSVSTAFGKTRTIRNNNDKEISNIKEISMEKNNSFIPPTIEEVASYCKERNNDIDPESFVAFYSSKGWRIGKTPMKNWKMAVITWEKRSKPKKKPEPIFEDPFDKYIFGEDGK